MRHVKIKMFMIMIPFTVLLTTTGCLTTLQTAKTRGGVEFTAGYLKTPLEYHRENVVLRPSFGISARENRIGFSFSLPMLIEYNRGYNGGFWEISMVSDEIKIQFPKNKWLDAAIGANFLLYMPLGRFLVISRDINKKMIIYGEIRNVEMPKLTEKGVNITKSTIGIKWDFYKYISSLLEISHWYIKDYDLPEKKKDYLEFGIGLNLHK